MSMREPISLRPLGDAPALPGSLPGHFFDLKEPMTLESGVVLPGIRVAYQTYGTLDSERSNAILVCHALTGDQFVADVHPITGKPGWWTTLVGPGKIIDTDRYFVICSNVLGGCLGTSGPTDINQATNERYGQCPALPD